MTNPVRFLVDFVRANFAELVKFTLVGFANLGVDIGVFNLLLFGPCAGWPITAKVISVTVATLFSWVVNRVWTFRGKGTDRLLREAVRFGLANVAGMLPSLLCLWISHYLMGLTSELADNISANVIGLALGTLVRYLAYRNLVFTGGRETH